MLISKEQHWRSQAEKLDNKIAGMAGEIPEVRKTKSYFDKLSISLKRMILRKQENVFFLNLDLPYRRC